MTKLANVVANYMQPPTVIGLRMWSATCATKLVILRRFVVRKAFLVVVVVALVAVVVVVAEVMVVVALVILALLLLLFLKRLQSSHRVLPQLSLQRLLTFDGRRKRCSNWIIRMLLRKQLNSSMPSLLLCRRLLLS